MHSDIPKRTLLVISDSAMYRSGQAVWVFEPVLRELDALTEIFDEIVWLGCNVKINTPVLKKNTNERIKTVVLPSVRHSWFNPLKVLFSYPAFLYQILKYISSATHIHTRAPSHPALIGMMLSRVDTKRVYWHKYAGNWIAKALPFMYRLQRKLLKNAANQRNRVTINGSGNGEYIYAFENPCLYEDERIAAFEISKSKNFDGRLSLLFVGNLMQSKGILNLLAATQTGLVSDRIQELYIIGEGPLKLQVDKIAISSAVKIHIVGSLSRETLNSYYGKAHFLILPSSSEGFPKVIAEAAAYGCIPVVTDISSIGRYIEHLNNGYLMQDNRVDTIVQAINTLASSPYLKYMSGNAAIISEKFTYERFIQQVKSKIISA